MYDGDILEYVFRNIDGKEIRRFHYFINETINGWEIRGIEEPRNHKSLKYAGWYEIIGNKYENPEWLGGK